MPTVVYKNPLPVFAVHFLSSFQESRCVWISRYKIVSMHKLSRERIESIRSVHLIGGGQSWGIKSTCDGTEQPAGTVSCPAVEVDNLDNILNDKPKHSYTGHVLKPIEQVYYEYIVEDMCDSSD